MKNTNEHTCPYAWHPCATNSEKPQPIDAFEEPEKVELAEPVKKPGQMPWTVFKDVYWI